MEQNPEDGETFLSKFIRKSRVEPFVPIGCLVTVGFLIRGLRAFKAGQSQTSQMMMRGRIGAQAFTIAAILAGVYSGFKPHDRPATMEEKMSRIESKS